MSTEERTDIEIVAHLAQGISDRLTQACPDPEMRLWLVAVIYGGTVVETSRTTEEALDLVRGAIVSGRAIQVATKGGRGGEA